MRQSIEGAPQNSLAQNSLESALDDLWVGFCQTSIWWTLAKLTIKTKFRRTVVGPFWITLSLVVWVIMLSFVNSSLFDNTVLSNIPRLTIGMIFWTLIATTVNDGCMSFINAEGLIKALPIKLSIHVYNNVAQNFLIFLFNMVLYPIILVILWWQGCLSSNILLLFPALAILLLTLVSINLLVATVSTRFRDIPRIVINFTQIVFFATPVFWIPKSKTLPLFVKFNPVYHMLEIVRSPLLCQYATAFSWIFSLTTMLFTTILTLIVYKKSYARIPLWL